MTGFEPATSCSQSKRATNCATSRYEIFIVFSFLPLLLYCRAPYRAEPHLRIVSTYRLRKSAALSTPRSGGFRYACIPVSSHSHKSAARKPRLVLLLALETSHRKNDYQSFLLVHQLRYIPKLK